MGHSEVHLTVDAHLCLHSYLAGGGVVEGREWSVSVKEMWSSDWRGEWTASLPCRCWLDGQTFAVMAESSNVAQLASSLEEVPPMQQWDDFSCCRAMGRRGSACSEGDGQRGRAALPLRASE